MEMCEAHFVLNISSWNQYILIALLGYLFGGKFNTPYIEMFEILTTEDPSNWLGMDPRLDK